MIIKVPRLQNGFTLLELLIVIAIIGILAAIVLASTSASRDKAQYTQVAQQLKEIEKALWLYHADHVNDTPYWNGSWTYWTGSIGGNFQIQKIIDPAPTNTDAIGRFPGFKNYLSSAPVSPFKAGFYSYFSKNNPMPSGGCYNNPVTIFSQGGPGVSIRIVPGGVNPEDLFTALDKIFDDGDGPTCGRVMFESANPPNTNWNIYYIISSTI